MCRLNAQAVYLSIFSRTLQVNKPKIIPRPEHNVSRANISRNAQKVLYRLHNSGFQSFLVGGGVRDVMLGLHPKDFDIATNAHPEEIKALFSNCRLIGRRFRLAHIRFGREIIEVATFRAPADHDDEYADVAHDQEGRILRDNVYGEVDDDVWRRDFTCNALYYNIADFSIWDYVGGIEDINKRVVKLIGDPEQRLREDPVRMLRAVRFAAKLNFSIDPNIVNAMQPLAGLLANVPSSRLFDEFIKLFQSGFAKPTFAMMREHFLFRELFPETERALLTDEKFGRFVQIALENTDGRVKNDQSVSPMFLLGVFFWAPVLEIANNLRADRKMSEGQALAVAAADVVSWHQTRISIPRRFSAPMREMIALQPRFTTTKGRRALTLLEHKRFRAAYDFMLLRAELGDVDQDLAKFWTDIQTCSQEERMDRLHLGGKSIKGANSGTECGAPSRKRPRRRRAKSAKPKSKP